MVVPMIQIIWKPAFYEFIMGGYDSIGLDSIKGVRLLCEEAMLRYIMVSPLNYSYHWKAPVPSPYNHSSHFLSISFMGQA